MITQDLLLKLFEGALVQRWNDKLRPIDFIESDKHGHKLVIAYFLAKHEEQKCTINWTALIEGALFEYLQKLVLTDLKSPIFYKIKSRPEQYQKLRTYVAAALQPILEPVDAALYQRFSAYDRNEIETIEQRILAAASTAASQWEFDIIERIDPHGFETEETKTRIANRLDAYGDLSGVGELKHNPSAQSFIDLCGQLRYQTRWAYLHRIPKTSVLSHCLFVALFAFLFSLQRNACSKRIYNNTFAGLFHDLPEVLTRDIIMPVKRSVEGLRDFLIEYEKEEMEKRVFPLLPPHFHRDIRTFTQLDVDARNHISVNGTDLCVDMEVLDEQYNDDTYNPCDGELVKAMDEFGAFLEAVQAKQNGCVSARFDETIVAFKEKYGAPEKSHLHLAPLIEIFG